METIHCMLDLETLSTRSNARIVAIGAVLFTRKGGLGERFYTPVKTPDLERARRITSPFHVEERTILWWEQQPEAARYVLWDERAVPIHIALNWFSDFLAFHTNDDVRMWGNGAAFDNAILATAYNLMGIEPPWKFYNDRCYRTVKNMYPDVPMKREGTHHNAVDDAVSQAKHLLSFGVYLS